MSLTLRKLEGCRLELLGHFGTPDPGDEAIVFAKGLCFAQYVPFGEFKDEIAALARIGGNAFAKTSAVMPVSLNEESNSLHSFEL